jgi:tripartite-type tricarboxylate transporter receptor subunit TctC
MEDCMTITRRRAMTLGSAAFGLPSVARAQTWPTGPVTFVVGYAAGGGPDINARGLAQVMPAVTGQPTIVDNRAGAGGSIGIRAAAGARPDGQTLLYATVANIVIIPWLQKGMIDTLTTLVPICLTIANQYALMVNAKLPVNNVAELVALARKEPGKLTYFSVGIGSATHLNSAWFTQAAGINVTHVPYKGISQALLDVIGGTIDMGFGPPETGLGHVKAGKLKMLAVTGDKRLKLLPDVPTLTEQGIDMVMNGWHGLFAPAKTPDAILDKIEKDAKRALTNPKWLDLLVQDGSEPPPERRRAEFAKFVSGEHAFWGRKLKELKIEME